MRALDIMRVIHSLWDSHLHCIRSYSEQFWLKAPFLWNTTNPCVGKFPCLWKRLPWTVVIPISRANLVIYSTPTNYFKLGRIWDILRVLWNRLFFLWKKLATMSPKGISTSCQYPLGIKFSLFLFSCSYKSIKFFIYFILITKKN